MRLTFTLEKNYFSLGGIGGSGGLLTTPDNVDRRASGGVLPTPLGSPFPEVVGSKAGSGLSVSVASPTPINARCAS